MINQQIIDYIKQETQKGVPTENIKNKLLANSWTIEDINQAYSGLSGTSSLTTSKGKSTKKLIWILIILLLIVMSGAFFACRTYFSNTCNSYFSKPTTVVPIIETPASIPISNETNNLNSSKEGTILVDTRPSSSPSSLQALSTSLVSKTGESTLYPIDIKINNSKTFTSFADGSTNTFFWNAPWATACVINSNVGPQGFVENTGIKQFTINFQGSDYPRELQISCNVESHKSAVKIDFAATPPPLPNFLFTFPTIGSSILRTISGSGDSKIITPQEVTISWTPQLKSVRLSLHDSATGQKIQDFALPVRFTDLSDNSFVWTLSGLKDGKYYIRVDAINFIETSLRSVDFIVQTKQSTK